MNALNLKKKIKKKYASIPTRVTMQTQPKGKQTPTKLRVCFRCPLRICFGSAMADLELTPSRPQTDPEQTYKEDPRFQKQTLKNDQMSLPVYFEYTRGDLTGYKKNYGSASHFSAWTPRADPKLTHSRPRADPKQTQTPTRHKADLGSAFEVCFGCVWSVLYLKIFLIIY